MSTGIGFLVGSAFADIDTRNQAQADELEAMRSRLRAKQQNLVFQRALTESAAAVHDEILDEIAQQQSPGGAQQPTSRRLSDPSNMEGRNRRLADELKTRVGRLSDYKTQLSDDVYKSVAKGKTLR